VKPVGLVLKAPARGGKFKLRLRCPRNARPGCAGGVRVGDIRAAFNIKPGRTVAIPIAESRSYGNTRGTRIRMDDPLYVVTHDEAGHTRTLKLRLTLLFT
jgi:hypothetical protein